VGISGVFVRGPTATSPVRGCAALQRLSHSRAQTGSRLRAAGVVLGRLGTPLALGSRLAQSAVTH